MKFTYSVVLNLKHLPPGKYNSNILFTPAYSLEPTRHRDGNEPGLLDLVFTNEEDMINDLKHNAGLGDSDHECLNFNLNCYGEMTPYF